MKNKDIFSILLGVRSFRLFEILLQNIFIKMEQQAKKKTLVLSHSDNIPKIIWENYRDTIIIIDQYKIDSFYIGKGKYADVHTADHTKNKKKICLKVVNLHKLKQQSEDNNEPQKLQKTLEVLQREEKILKQCNNKFIIQCYGCISNQFCKVYFLEYCSRCTLRQFIQQKPQQSLEEKDAIRIIKLIIFGARYLYENKIIHRDLKLENIALSEKGAWKILDFGFSKNIQDKNQDFIGSQLGTGEYQAPEIKLYNPYGTKADIFSIGVIFLKLVVGNLPQDERTPTSFRKNMNSLRNCRGQKLSAETLDFLKKMLKVDPKERIGWSQLIHHKIFQSFPQTQSQIQEFVDNPSSVVPDQMIQQWEISNLVSEKSSLVKPNEQREVEDENREKKVEQNRMAQKQQKIYDKVPTRDSLQHLQKSLKGYNSQKPKNSYIKKPLDPEKKKQYLPEQIKIDFQKKKIHEKSMILQDDNGGYFINFCGVDAKKEIAKHKLSKSVLPKKSQPEVLQKPCQEIPARVRLFELNEDIQKIKFRVKIAKYIFKNIINLLNIINKQKKDHLQLMILLCQRVHIDLWVGLQYMRKYGLKKREQDLINPISEAAKKLQYYKKIYEEQKSNIRGKINQFAKSIYSSLYKSVSAEQQMKHSILDGEQSVNFTREEQIDLTCKYIDKILEEVQIYKFAARLKAYKEIVQLQGAEEKFQEYLFVILQKY